MPYTRCEMKELFFPPGEKLDSVSPLARFLPPLEAGVAGRLLIEENLDRGLILDPFGVSPRLALEAAKAGAAVLVAANNPIARFILQLRARLLPEDVLRTALAHLSSAIKDNQRLEPFLLNLYRTICSRCGSVTHVRTYIWDRERNQPIAKIYTCNSCGHHAEEATDEADRGRARQYSSHGLQYALALERLAPIGDPYRKHAEAALDVYTGRAVYALVTLISKLEQLAFPEPLCSAAQALLLHAFDACNAIWAHPEGRARPKQLSLSPQFREQNVWFALEDAVEAWSYDAERVPLRILSLEENTEEDFLPKQGEIVVFPGTVRDLAGRLLHDRVDGLLTVLPRPNHAYWTLAALWTSWLWGREKALPFKAALRRRRYDWGWHAGALRTTLGKLTAVLAQETPVIAIIPEAEPGFLAAALAGLDGIGYRLAGRALRADVRQALLTWRVDHHRSLPLSMGNLGQLIDRSVEQILQERGEPSPFLVLHAAAWTALAQQQAIRIAWNDTGGHPLTVLGSSLETALADRNRFAHLSRSPDPELGQYWLQTEANVSERLADRIEDVILKHFRAKRRLSRQEIVDHVYRKFPGLLCPDDDLVLQCIQSYAQLEEPGGDWVLREEDQAQVRQHDVERIRALLHDLGIRLGYQFGEEGPLIWLNSQGYPAHRFRVQATAAIGSQLLHTIPPWTLVVPGGRAALIMEKARRDPRLHDWLQIGVRLLKFRHVRRLVEDMTLTQANLVERLGLDPPEHQDPQLPLL